MHVIILDELDTAVLELLKNHDLLGDYPPLATCLASAALLSKAEKFDDGPLGVVQYSSGQVCSPAVSNLESEIRCFVNPERQQP